MKLNISTYRISNRIFVLMVAFYFMSLFLISCQNVKSEATSQDILRVSDSDQIEVKNEIDSKETDSEIQLEKQSSNNSLETQNKQNVISLKDFPLSGLVREVFSGNQIEVMIDSHSQPIRVQYLGVKTNNDDGTGMNSSFGLNKFLCLDKTALIAAEDAYFDPSTNVYHAYVFVQGEFINQVLIANGFAFVDESNILISKLDQLVESQNEAMMRGLGMWEGFASGGGNVCGTLPCAK